MNQNWNLSIKFKELIQEDDYYVSDIVDYTQYSNRPDQKIIQVVKIIKQKPKPKLSETEKRKKKIDW